MTWIGFFCGTDSDTWILENEAHEYRYLKLLTNEKRGGLTVVSFDRSGFKLFSL
jgi:hypothetical protein